MPCNDFAYGKGETYLPMPTVKLNKNKEWRALSCKSCCEPQREPMCTSLHMQLHQAPPLKGTRGKGKTIGIWTHISRYSVSILNLIKLLQCIIVWTRFTKAWGKVSKHLTFTVHHFLQFVWLISELFRSQFDLLPQVSPAGTQDDRILDDKSTRQCPTQTALSFWDASHWCQGK